VVIIWWEIGFDDGSGVFLGRQLLNFVWGQK
jgi:hypothetical protein